jgi:hypothetical protein
MPRLLSPSTTGAFGQLGARVLGDHPLPRRESFAVRTVATWMLEKAHWRVHLLDRLDQEPWMRRVTGEPIRRQSEGARTVKHGKAQPRLAQGIETKRIRRHPRHPLALTMWLGEERTASR